MTSRKQQKEELAKLSIILPNIKGREMSKKDKDDYFKLIRMERKRLGKDPTANVVAALHQADELLKKAESEKNHPSTEDMQSAMNESKSVDTDK